MQTWCLNDLGYAFRRTSPFVSFVGFNICTSYMILVCFL
jgi:hypothetical protein